MLKVTIQKHDDEVIIKYVDKVHHMDSSGGLTLDTIVKQRNKMLQEIEREYISFDDCLLIQIEEEKD